MFFRTGVIVVRIFMLYKLWIFDPSAAVTLNWTFIYELDPYSLEIYMMCKYKLPVSMLLKVTV